VTCRFRGKDQWNPLPDGEEGMKKELNIIILRAIEKG